MSDARIPTTDLLADLHAVAETVDRTPRVADVHEHATYSYDTFRRRFGGMARALDAAGIEPHARAHCGRRDLDRKALIADLRRLGDDLDRPPTRDDVQRDGTYSVPTYYNHFDGFADALQEAGFPADSDRGIPREQLLEGLCELARKVDGPPTSGQMAALGPHAPVTYRRRFGGWEQALEEAGLTDDGPADV